MSHPVAHWFIVFAFYNIGLLINMLGQAFATTISKLNGINSVRTYLGLRWIPLAMRWFACFCAFLIVWENPSVLPIEKYMPTFGVQLGVSGFLGLGSDAVFDRILGIILPGVHKTLPPVPSANPNAPNPPAS